MAKPIPKNEMKTIEAMVSAHPEGIAIQNELCPKVGDGVRGGTSWRRTNAVNSRRERDMPHE